MYVLARIEVPQGIARLRVNGFKGLGIVAEKEQPACGAHNSTGRMPLARLRIAPGRFVGFKTESEHIFLGMIPGTAAGACGIVCLSFGKFLWLYQKHIAVFAGKEIEKVSRGIVRRRIPVRGPDESRTGARALCRGLHAGSNRTALRINALRPIEFVHEWKSREKLSTNAVQNVEKSIAIGLDKQLSRLPPVVSVDQDGSLRCIVVIQVVRRKLKIPFELSRIRVQGQHAVGVKIVPRPRTAIKVGSGIAGA